MADLEWEVRLERPDEAAVTLAQLYEPLHREQVVINELEGLTAKVRVRGPVPIGKLQYTMVEAEISATAEPIQCYLTLECTYASGALYTFLGESTEREVYRQSPHDPADHKVDFAKQAVPMAAICDEGAWTVAVSDNPSTCDNYTTQDIDPQGHHFALTSGDSGLMPGYVGKHFDPYFHTASPGKPHVFRVILFKTQAADFRKLRQDLFEVIDAAWGEGRSRFHALCFATNYMHWRRNELGYSDIWIVPGIEYANKQYTRDAFWQTSVFPLHMEQQAYNAVYEERYKYAENGMLFLIWSHRIQRRGGQADLVRARDALGYVESNTRDGWYHAARSKPTPDFRSWYDPCSFEDDDVVSYNQGLLPVALLAAQALGLEPKTPVEQAMSNYQALYLGDGPFFPLSKFKRAICVDALVGDLLANIEFDEPLLSDDSVRQHYITLITRAKTPYGFKVTCAEDGSYLPAEAHSADGFLNPFFLRASPGVYAWGGSWYLYDMLCLMDCFAHHTEGAEEEIIQRTALEIELGGTYHEYINTVTGQPGKPNYGWNAAVYALWEEMIRQGKANRRFFDEIELLLKA